MLYLCTEVLQLTKDLKMKQKILNETKNYFVILTILFCGFTKDEWLLNNYLFVFLLFIITVILNICSVCYKEATL